MWVRSGLVGDGGEEVFGVVSGCEMEKYSTQPRHNTMHPCTMPITNPCTTQLARHHTTNPTPPEIGTVGLHNTAARHTESLIFDTVFSYTGVFSLV